jgi:prepilin-type N-terminal cleavage/methylation domain-containing protein
MTTRSSGFTLIELVVVVAIIGILAAVAITAYSNYISNAKIKNAENTLLQLSLAQTEFFTDNRIYNVDADVNCPATSDTSAQLSTDLVDDDIITEINADGDFIHDFDYCADANGTNGFLITADATTESNIVCTLIINENGVIDRSGCPQ